MENLPSNAPRHPAPPTILFRDSDWAEAPNPSKLSVPDSSTFEVEYPVEVTWFFEKIENYTAQPYVFDVPTVDFLGYKDRQSKSVLFDAFYLFGRQLVPGDVEFMQREGWSLMRFVDTLIKTETGGAEDIFSRVFERQKRFKAAGLMWLPFLDGSGLTARAGTVPQALFESLPLYGESPEESPPYVLEDEVVKSEANVNVDIDELYEDAHEDQPPSYECTMSRDTAPSVNWPIASGVEALEDKVNTECAANPRYETVETKITPEPAPAAARPTPGSTGWLKPVLRFLWWAVS